MENSTKRKIIASLKSIIPRFSVFAHEEYELLEKGQFVGSVIDEIYLIGTVLKPCIKSNAKVIDLGSGDGRVVAVLGSMWPQADITGIEYNLRLYRASQKLKGKLNLSNIKFFRHDFLKEDLSQYDVLFYYFWGSWQENTLVNKLNAEVKPNAFLILYGHGLNVKRIAKLFGKNYQFLSFPQIKDFSLILRKI